MMTAEFYQLATALEKLGLVKFTQRVTRSGRLDGHDATATQEGLRLLKQHGMLPKHRAHDVD